MAFTGKVVLITGASSGIGASTAVVFAKEGAILALTGRNLLNLEKTKQNCKEVAPNKVPEPVLIQADLTKEADLEKIVQETIKHCGKLNVLVNNAGIAFYKPLESTSMSEYDALMQTNVRAPYYLTKLLIEHLAKTEGNVVNVSSVMGSRGFQNVNAYSCTKAALEQFTRCTALEVASKKIRVNAVCPAFTITNFQKAAGMADKMYQQIVENCKTSYPLGRAGEPEDVADAIYFLASDKARFITGACLPVDGGKSCQCPR